MCMRVVNLMDNVAPKHSQPQQATIHGLFVQIFVNASVKLLRCASYSRLFGSQSALWRPLISCFLSRNQPNRSKRKYAMMINQFINWFVWNVNRFQQNFPNFISMHNALPTKPIPLDCGKLMWLIFSLFNSLQITRKTRPRFCNDEINARSNQPTDGASV